MSEFIEFPEYGAPNIDRETAETPDRIDLRDLPLDTLIEFHGVHPVSRYLVQLTDITRMQEIGARLQKSMQLPESQSGKYIKVWWLNHTESNCAVGPLDGLAWFEDSPEERYLMAIGKSYTIPYFTYREGEAGSLELKLSFAEARFEAYTKIFVQRPRASPT